MKLAQKGEENNQTSQKGEQHESSCKNAKKITQVTKKVNKIFQVAKKGQQNIFPRQKLVHRVGCSPAQTQHSNVLILVHQYGKASGIVDGNFPCWLIIS